ncbi:MAG: LytTR family DNA-binding domain-containing protein [Clostridium sp.]|nr:LytTR family DNA-binding domain-containing protein [Clostridium sp.]
MIHIAVCDDELNVCYQLEEYIKQYKDRREIELEIFNRTSEFEKALKERFFDIIFLDVVMKDRTGIQLGEFIREKLKNDSSLLVYMSGYGEEYALDLFQFQPFHFLKKPIEAGEFRKVFYKAWDRVRGDTGIFEFKSSRTIYRLPLKDIMYFEGDNRRVRIATEDNVYYCYSTIEKLFSKINMEQYGFVRLHKSYAVNMRYVAAFSVRMVTLFDSTEFTISAPFRENAQKRYNVFSEKLKQG